ncbi:MAG: inorganic diphosphatase [Legionellales bacterium]|nr:inorganic diphosphatase [Legionellales bacterium]
MNLAQITVGQNPPNDINVVIEIPAHSGPVKYEVDKASGSLMVDRFMATAMYYPANYGFIPNTLAEDNDPVDVLVLTPVPLINNSVIRCRPVGMLQMTDESGPDSKILAVPITKLSQLYAQVQSPDDLPTDLLHSIEHFFTHYKDLETDKWVKIGGWQSSEAAKVEIIQSIERHS